MVSTGLLLYGPGRDEQQLHALRGEQLLDGRPRGVGEFLRRRVAVGQERDRVDAEQRVLVGRAGQDELAGLRLTGLHRALDLVGLVEGAIGMQHDLQLAAAGLGHVGSELLHVLGLEAADGVAGGQVPLRRGGRLGQGAAEQRGAEHREDEGLHRGISGQVGGFRSWPAGGSAGR
jgi:hypothetical protein